MKTPWFVSAIAVMGLSSSVSVNVLAAPAKPSSSTLSSALEVLKLPTENRRMVLSNGGEKFYQNFISVAFNDAQPMSVRWRALMAAAEVHGDRSTPDLLKAGKHNQWYMRNAALVALTEVNPSQGEKLAQSLLKDKALVVRSAAVEALAKSTQPAVRDLLWDELNQKYNFKGDHSLWIRYQIVETLAKKPLNHEAKIFAGLLSDKDQRLHMPAVAGLEKLTGVKLGEGTTKSAALVGMWKDYVKKEKIEL